MHPRRMVLRFAGRAVEGTDGSASAWDVFAKGQEASEGWTECITQPSHAALAGRLARVLEPALFGVIPDEVAEVIGDHDTGWAEADLRALERVDGGGPESFLAVSPEDGVRAWRRSVRAAEEKSALAGVLTSRHFCLLAPPGDEVHEEFRRTETERRREGEASCGVGRADLDRFTAALGFCDLLSLVLCSGLRGTVRLPIGHPAAPEAREAEQMWLDTRDERGIRFDRRVLRADSEVAVAAWQRMDGGFCGRRLLWRSA